jgi:peptidylprolyl isomerase
MTTLELITQEVGSGAQPQAGDMVQVHYIGTLADGTEFDNSYKRGEPISFVLGRGQVIQGWDMGIAQMQVGGKAKLIIPPDLGYGARGAGGVIPPNATLHFAVELVGVLTVEYTEKKAGTGAQPQRGQTVAVHYIGMLLDGTEFDNSYKRGEPIRFKLGAGQVIPGWDMGIAQMREGGKAELVIPPDLAYGARGAGGVIPPNATLRFRVELVQVG